jgi:hypothetical protein
MKENMLNHIITWNYIVETPTYTIEFGYQTTPTITT